MAWTVSEPTTGFGYALRMLPAFTSSDFLPPHSSLPLFVVSTSVRLELAARAVTAPFIHHSACRIVTSPSVPAKRSSTAGRAAGSSPPSATASVSASWSAESGLIAMRANHSPFACDSCDCALVNW